MVHYFPDRIRLLPPLAWHFPLLHLSIVSVMLQFFLQVLLPVQKHSKSPFWYMVFGIFFRFFVLLKFLILHFLRRLCNELLFMTFRFISKTISFIFACITVPGLDVVVLSFHNFIPFISYHIHSFLCIIQCGYAKTSCLIHIHNIEYSIL